MNKTPGLILRILLGAYLTYLGVDLIRTVIIENPTDMMMKAAMGVAFIVVGIWYAIWAVRGAWKRYNKETPEIPDVEEEQEDEEEN